MRRRSGDGGFTAVEWTVGIAVLILPAVLIALSVAGWVQRTSMARTIAQESARALVLADSVEEGEVLATTVAREIAANYGLDASNWCDVPADGCVSMVLSGDFVRGGVIRVVVEVPVPAIFVPFIGEVGAFQWGTSHAERIDDYRSFP